MDIFRVYFIGPRSRERKKERDEQKREAKTQLALELKRNDIKIIEDAIDNNLKSLEVLQLARLKNTLGLSSESAMKTEILSAILDDNSKLMKLSELNIMSDKLAYTLGEKFHSEFENWDDLTMNYWEFLGSSSYSNEAEQKLRMEIVSSAAKLHNMLQEKLISIRDT